jgi:glycosyltransferase involved in cell wall biosynthesis
VNGPGEPPPPGAPGADGGEGRARIGYLLKVFPRLSETFILNEVLELERQGVDLCVYSMNEPQEALRHDQFERLRARVSYLPYPLLPAARTYLGAHLALARRHPLAYLATFFGVCFSFDRDLAERFVQAGELARRLRADGVTHLHAGFVHFPGSVAWIVHRITGLPFSLATHARDVYLGSPRRLLRRKLAEAEVVFTCSRYNLPNLEALAAPRRIRRLRHVYHGTDLERFRYEPAGACDPPLILAVGRLVEKKGLDHLVTACGLLRDRGRRFRCRIVAGSRDRWDELAAQIRRLGLESLVTLEGPLEQQAVHACYRAASLLALPCVIADDGDRDGIPNVLVEAAAVGVPIVTTAVSGIPELVQDGRTGLIVPPRDPAALAAAMERLLGSSELRQRLREHARARVEELFDLRRNSQAVVRELALVTGARRRTGRQGLRTAEHAS